MILFGKKNRDTDVEDKHMDTKGGRRCVWWVGRLGLTHIHSWWYIWNRELMRTWGFPGVLVVKNLPAMQETWVQSLSQEDPLEKEMATHSSILAWEVPWTEEPGGLQSMGSQKSQTCLASKQQYKTLLYSTGDSFQCSVVTWMGRKSKERGGVCVQTADSLCCAVKRIQCCKATIFQ